MPFLQRSRKIVQQAKHPQDQPATEHATQNARHYDAPHQKGAASFAQPHFFKLGFQFFLWNDLDQPILGFQAFAPLQNTLIADNIDSIMGLAEFLYPSMGLFP